MKFSHAVVYAINAMLYLAKAERGVPIPCRQIAKDRQMPERFLLQVLRILVNHGLLNSTRGIDGGYSLSKLPQEISLADIVGAFENPLTLQLPELECFTKATREKVFTTLEQAADAARAELERVTLEELTADPEVRSAALERLTAS